MTSLASAGSAVQATENSIDGQLPAEPDRPMLDVTVPVYNEERDLASCVRRLHAAPHRHFPTGS